MEKILKISNYDEFKCTADKCKFTCCEGWDVSIDNATYSKWKSENNEFDYILKKVKDKKYSEKAEYFINKKIHDKCPFLDKKGLCDIVKNHGEEYLSSTCRKFPRIENNLEGIKEFSLNCACPEVVEIINNMDSKVKMVSERGAQITSDLLEIRLRDTIIKIIQQDNITLDYKLMLSFEMIVELFEMEELDEDEFLAELEKYEKREYIKERVEDYGETEHKRAKAIKDFNSLFLDIAQNYKEVSYFKILLSGLFSFAEKVEIEALASKWDEYTVDFRKFEGLLENCIISKILGSCINDNFEDMIIDLEMVIIEYLLVRYAIFLKSCMSEKEQIDIADVKDYIVVFSRIIGNNLDAVIEFFREYFGDEILELEYLKSIILF